MEVIKLKSGKQIEVTEAVTYLDTLGQLGTKRLKPEFDFDLVATKFNKEKLQKRARVKFLAYAIFKELYRIARDRQDIKMKKYIRHAFNCSNFIKLFTNLDDGEKYTQGIYCKTKICPVCSRINTGMLINRYSGEIETWKEKYHVVLSARNVKLEHLAGRIDLYWDVLNKFVDLKKKQAKRNLSGKLKMFVKLEVTYNEKTKEYHPHFHILGNEEIPEIIDYWLEKWGNEAERSAQDIKKADDAAVYEVFKYITKLLKKEGKKLKIMDIEALYELVKLQYGKKTFRKYGIKTNKEITDFETEKGRIIIGDSLLYEWVQTENDWINGEDHLSGYEPSKYILESVRELEGNKNEHGKKDH